MVERLHVGDLQVVGWGEGPRELVKATRVGVGGEKGNYRWSGVWSPQTNYFYVEKIQERGQIGPKICTKNGEVKNVHILEQILNLKGPSSNLTNLNLVVDFALSRSFFFSLLWKNYTWVSFNKHFWLYPKMEYVAYQRHNLKEFVPLRLELTRSVKRLLSNWQNGFVFVHFLVVKLTANESSLKMPMTGYERGSLCC